MVQNIFPVVVFDAKRIFQEIRISSVQKFGQVNSKTLESLTFYFTSSSLLAFFLSKNSSLVGKMEFAYISKISNFSAWGFHFFLI